jgi:cell division transport system permease protein
MSNLRMDRDLMTPRAMAGLLPRSETPIIPKTSVAGRSLVAVVAIMTFLSSLTIGAVTLVRSAAIDWQSDVSREITIQVRPTEGRDIEAEVQRAVAIARKFPGVGEVRPLSRQESARLLEPWLGGNLALEDLPVPRLIVIKLSGETTNLTALRASLSGQVAGATLDDHRVWIERMRRMAQTSVIVGAGILILMLAATVLSVSFATRGAMATNRPIVEVLHFIGARNGFIAAQFQRHFLLLGLEGGAVGGGLAMLVFGIAGFVANMSSGAAGGDQLVALFGTATLGLGGYGAIAGLIMVVAVVTAVTSRRTVNQTLEMIE